MPPKMSGATLAVLAAFLNAGAKPVYGRELMEAGGVKSGTLYPILDRLEDEGWIVGEWEAVDPRTVGRPRRRYYKLTGAGAVAATREVQRASARLRVPSALIPRPAQLGELR